MIMAAIAAVIIVAFGGVGIYYWYHNAYFVETEDAKVNGDLVKVSPQITARLLEFNAEEGDTVIKDQILGRQETINLPETNIEQSVIRAPIDGLVIKKSGNAGEIVSSGQTLAVIVDPARLYITANIEETKLERIRPGQTVDIAIDQYDGVPFRGTVSSIGQASNSTFSLLATSTGSTFTKVVQKIPVKIEFDQKKNRLLPGTNTVVRIHIK